MSVPSPEVFEEAWRDLAASVDASDAVRATAILDAIPAEEIPRAVTLMPEAERFGLFELVAPDDAARLIEQFPEPTAADFLEPMPTMRAAAILARLESGHRADVLGELSDEDAEAILRQMDPEEAAGARRLLEYDEDTAGGIMGTEYVAYYDHMSVAEVLSNMRDHAKSYHGSGIYYFYVTSKRGSLIGVLQLRDLVLADPDSPVRDVMLVNPVYVVDTMKLPELEAVFDRVPFSTMPVTNANGRIVGVVRRSDLEEALARESDRAFLRFGGIIRGSEMRSLPLLERTTFRLVWLLLNMALSIVAASVILGFQGTVNQVFALVFFMPVICNMSGCSGNQAVAVSIRELTLGLIKPADYRRVWMQEVAVGLVNGIVLGTLIGLVAMLVWTDLAPYLGLVIGAAFALNTLVAVSIGGLIPLLLVRVGVDPALAAPPILTTATDMCGFLLVLSLAGLALYLGVL